MKSPGRSGRPGEGFSDEFEEENAVCVELKSVWSDSLILPESKSIFGILT